MLVIEVNQIWYQWKWSWRSTNFICSGFLQSFWQPWEPLWRLQVCVWLHLLLEDSWWGHGQQGRLLPHLLQLWRTHLWNCQHCWKLWHCLLWPGILAELCGCQAPAGNLFNDQILSVSSKWTQFQGVWGFISGGLVWFAIPFTLATTMGLAYLGLSSAQGAPMLTDEDVAKGLAAPLVAQKLLGSTGEYAVLFLILMAVMSTGSDSDP